VRKERAMKTALMKAPFTKQSRVLGLPIGPRHTDWVRVGKLAAMGVGAISTAAGGVGAKRAGSRIRGKESGGGENAQESMQDAGRGDTAEADEGPETTPDTAEADQGPETKESDGEGERGGGEEHLKKLRQIIKESVDVGVPLKTAYNQWTQFTELPSIMKGPQQVDQEADDETRWIAKIGPSRRRWTGKILEQNPDERIVWESTDGTENRGAVTFHRLDRNLTRIQVEMEYSPNGFVEKVGNVFLAARRRTRKDLRLFKHYLELAGSETGAWRGEISTDNEAEPEPEEQQPEERSREGAEQRSHAGDGSPDRGDDETRAQTSEHTEGTSEARQEDPADRHNEREASTA
jgi:uncharacterized membrane protein